MENYTGEIVRATCIAVEENRVLARFGEDERLNVAYEEWTAEVGDEADVYIDGPQENGEWPGSVQKTEPLRLWQKVEYCCANHVDLDAYVVAFDGTGLICDACSLMARMPWKEIGEEGPHDGNQYVGKTISARIVRFSVEDGAIVLSHRAAAAREKDKQRSEIWESLAPGQRHTGTVRRIVDYGAFVDIGAGTDGLVHRSELSWTGADPASVVAVGDTVEVVVLSVERERRRLSLSVRQTQEDPWNVLMAQSPLGKAFDVTVVRFAHFGAFVSLGAVEGLIHVSEMSDKHVEKPESVLKIGQTVRATVIRIDASKRRLALSLIAEPFVPGESVGLHEETQATLADVFPKR